MERNPKLKAYPTFTKELKACQRIKIIYLTGYKDYHYMRSLGPSQLNKLNLNLANIFALQDAAVDFSELSFLKDIKVLNHFNKVESFEPHFLNIIEQIPKDLIDNVVAIQIIYTPHYHSDSKIFRKEYEKKFHVSIVRLYQAKNDSNESTYPFNASLKSNYSIPLGMSKGDFNKISAHLFN